MKIRVGYVSNSSSSSFVVISKNKADADTVEAHFETLKQHCDKNVFDPFSVGEKKFGWQTVKYNDFFDKLNWAFLQAFYASEYCKKQEPLSLLDKLFAEADLFFDWSEINELKKSDHAYIDHQSSCRDDEDQLHIFTSMSALKAFLFNKDSYIQCGNDNG